MKLSQQCSVRDDNPFPKEHRLYYCGSFVLHVREHLSVGVQCNLLGRLKPGITIAQAQSEMNVIMSSLEREYPNSNKDTAAIVRSEMSRRLENGAATPGFILLGLVALVLMMACANVASLMMARAASRIREISTQSALGAFRAALVRRFLTERAGLAVLGGFLAFCWRLVASGALRRSYPTPLLPQAQNLKPDTRVLGIASSTAPRCADDWSRRRRLAHREHWHRMGIADNR
jgi:hypothetical protein